MNKQESKTLDICKQASTQLTHTAISIGVILGWIFIIWSN